MLLFNRITCAVKKEKELVACFVYDLAPRPPSLFEDSMMRKIKNKAVLCEILENLVPCERSVHKEYSDFALDGGFL